MIAATRVVAQAPSPYNPDIVKNFIRTWDAKAPVSNYMELMNRPLSDVVQSTQYLDGLGRPLQSVIKQGSLETGGTAADVVNAVFYDPFGREQYKYLPFAANNTGGYPVNDGNFKLNPFVQQGVFMQAQYGAQNESHFYARTNFETSPLSRPEKNMAPGINWAGADRGVQQKYWLTTTGDAPVKIWTVTNNSPGNFGDYSTGGDYPVGELYKNLVIDEEGKQVIELKDKDGKVILKKVQLTGAADEGNGSAYTGWLCTYYIYDNLGSLRCVIQPKAVETMAAASNWTLSAEMLEGQCFRYEYDSRRRMIMKKVPGAAPVYMVYDKRDRLVMTRDGNLSTAGKWLVTLYDELNRPVQTGLWESANNWSFHSSQAASSSNYYYPFTESGVPGSGWEMLTQTHYDNYLNLPAGPTASYLPDWNSYFLAANNQWPYPQQPQQSNATRGLVTWTKVRVLESNPVMFIVTVNIYDDKARIIQSKNTNMLGGTDVVSTQYNWAGQPLVSVQKSEKPGPVNPQVHVYKI